jgi:hypothetical protein
LEYDQDTWGYCLFDVGTFLDRFWSDPGAVDTPPEECTGDAEVANSVLGVPSESVAPYIRHVTEDEVELKAFDDDEFPLGDHWVRVDFMRRLGLNYPLPGRAAGGRRVRLWSDKRNRWPPPINRSQTVLWLMSVARLAKFGGESIFA